MPDQGNFPGQSFKFNMIGDDSSFVHLKNGTSNKLKKAINSRFDRFGGFEFPVITNNGFNDDDVTFASTIINARAHERVGVEFAGEVPRQGFQAVMYKKSFLDWPIALGLSAFNTN